MSKKLFVGSLDWGTNSETLRQGFAEHGNVVEARVIEDRYSGRSRGFGFVTFATSEGAERALDEMDGVTFDGRQIRVEVARDRGDRGPRRSSNDSHGSSYSNSNSSTHNNWRGGHRGW